MADEPKSTDLELEQEGPGIGFRLEMWFTDNLVRYWRVLGGSLVVILIGALVYGQYETWDQSNQRRFTGSIADIEGEMDDPIDQLVAIKAGAVPDRHIDVAKITDTANKLVGVAKGASGTARAEACLKASELFRIAGDLGGRRAALEICEADATGVLKYAVEAGLATIDIEENKPDAALTRYRELQRLDDELARMATIDLGSALEALDRRPEALTAYEEFLQKWPEAPERADVEARKAKLAGQG